MTRSVLLAIFIIATAGMGLPGAAQAQVSVGVQTSNLQLGINVGPVPPPMLVVPGPVVIAPGPPAPPPVYYAPNLPYNYFVYQNVHYVYHHGQWFWGRQYNGPWTAIAINQVPRPILAVPADHYRNRPPHWAQHGPPPWAREQAKEKHGHGKGHDKHNGHD